MKKEQMKKSAKKSGAKKEEKPNAAEAFKPEDTKEEDTKEEDTKEEDTKEEDTKEEDTKEEDAKAEDAKPELEVEAPEDENGDDSKGTEGSDGKDAEQTVSETVSGLTTPLSHQRKSSSSISQQSKMRSSSFRSPTGPLSPGHGFPPEENTAPEIYRKQALRIEELEKENKRLAKEASDGEKRWKRAEEELEDLREAEGDSSSKEKDASSAVGSSGELEKLVHLECSITIVTVLTYLENGSRSSSASEFPTSSPSFPSTWLVPVHVVDSTTRT
jgi:hypothetical protein